MHGVWGASRLVITWRFRERGTFRKDMEVLCPFRISCPGHLFPNYSLLYYIILYCIILYYIVLYSLLYCIIDYWWEVKMLVSQLCPTLCDPMDCSPHPTPPTPRLLCPWNSPSKNTGVSSHSLHQASLVTHVFPFSCLQSIPASGSLGKIK